VICTDDFSSDSFFYVVILEKYDEVAVSLDVCVVIAKDVERNVVRRNGAATSVCVLLLTKVQVEIPIQHVSLSTAS
jgi:hypothetical protein